MSWLLIAVLVLGSLLSSLEANFLQSAVVVGTVYCDTCFNLRFSKTGHFIPGASIAVQCENENAKVSFYEEAKTDEHGEFRVRLPFYVAQHVRKIEGCSVKPIDSGEPFCSLAMTAASSLLRLTLNMPGTHIFSAGNFLFKPLIQPAVCSQEPSLDYRKFSGLQSGFIPPTFGPWSTEPENPNVHHVTSPVTPFPLPPWIPPVPQIPQVPLIPEHHIPTPRPVRDESSSEAPSFDEEFFRPRLGLFPSATPRRPLPLPILAEPEDPFTMIPNISPPPAVPAFPAPFPVFPIPFMPRIPGFPTAKPSNTETPVMKNSP